MKLKFIRIIIFFVFSNLIFPLVLFAQAEKPVFYSVKLEGMIDRGLLPLVERAIQEAEKNQARGVIFEINTFGGRVDAAVEIRDAIIKTNLLTIAFINRRAISAGALISIACDKIIMADGGTIGAATPVEMGPSQEMKPVEEKVVSYFRSEMRSTAEHSKRDPQIAEAMVDPDVEIKGLSPKGKLLTLTTTDALKIKFVDGSGESMEAVLSILGFDKPQTRDVAINWAEQFVRFLTHPMVSSLLMAVGFLGIFLAFKTGQFGILGSLAILALVFFFFGHFTVKLVGWEEIILFLVGMGFLIAEIFFIPGFGFTGIIGILAVLAALFLSLIDMKAPISPPDIATPLYQIAASIALTMIGIFIAIKYLPKSKWGENIILQAKISENNSKNPSSLNQPSSQPTPPTSPNDHSLSIGSRGITQSSLRPSGIAQFGSKRIQVLADGEFIEPACEVEVVEIAGSKILVKLV